MTNTVRIKCPAIEHILKEGTSLEIDLWCATYLLQMLQELGIKSARGPNWGWNIGNSKVEQFTFNVRRKMTVRKT